MKYTLLALAAFTAHAHAQGIFAPTAPTTDLSAYATTASVNATVAAATPAPCSVPLADTLTGSAGTQPVCMTRPDANRPTAVQSSTAAADAAGNISVTFARTMASSSPSINLVPQNSAGGLPIVCNWLTRSSTGFTAGCWQSQTTTLGGTLTAVVGTVVSPFKAGASGVAVTWFAREPTQ